MIFKSKHWLQAVSKLRTLCAQSVIIYVLSSAFPAFSEPLLNVQSDPTEVSSVIPENNAEKSNSSEGRISGEYFKGYVTDSAKMLVSPVNWSAKEWLATALIAGTTGGLYVFDDQIRDFAQRNKSHLAGNFASIGNALGDPIYTLPPLGLLYLYGHLADDSAARRTSLLATESFAISGVLCLGIKFVTERHRPNSGDSPGIWDGPKLKTGNLSVPSGHTTSAFAMATVIAEEYRDNQWIPPIAYGLATLTGLSRIYTNDHWASDVFLGAALGYLVGKAVTGYHDGKHHSDTVIILPVVSQQWQGLAAEYRF